MIVAAAALAGLFMFAAPLAGLDQPASVPLLSAVLTGIALLAVIEVATRRLDARAFALLAVIAAVDAALRLVLVIGIGGFSPIFFLILCAGYVYGPSFGFLCGALSLLASALVTGGVGPWLPYELVGCGWLGMIAGLAGLRRQGIPSLRDVAVLAVIALVTGYLYGALLDLWDWTTFYRGVPDFGWAPGLGLGALPRFVRFYLTTSLLWDTFRAVGDALLVIVIGLPVLAALRRLRARFTVTVLSPAPEL
ncbi:MAG TPA: ECF transporter S component [Candidatus Dormibacteraeota bacterium]|nr:ECF transporter S component [Candidatus Dormibacteraeota bacterium]